MEEIRVYPNWDIERITFALHEPNNARQREAIALLDAASDEHIVTTIDGVGERAIVRSPLRSITFYYLCSEWS